MKCRKDDVQSDVQDGSNNVGVPRLRLLRKPGPSPGVTRREPIPKGVGDDGEDAEMVSPWPLVYLFDLFDLVALLRC